MGEVVPIRRPPATRPAAACAPRPSRPTLFFDLASPFTYLAAERADRTIPGLAWMPVPEDVLHRGPRSSWPGAEERARELRMPLVWPERRRGGGETPVAAMRVASLAAERGRGAAFVLAAGRLAFCGGFDLDEIDTVLEAAAAASLPLADALQAAGETSRDGAMEHDARRLLAQGADRLPVIRVGRTLFCGEERLVAAAGAARERLRAG